MNIQQQSELYLNQLTTRKRNPAKPSTLAAYKSYIHKWIVPNVGQYELTAFENGAMKELVGILSDHGLSAASIAGVQNCVKGIVSSAVDQNGNKLYERKWNADFIDAPQIDVKEQKAPTITPTTLASAISLSDSQFGTLLALLAGSGCRIGEALALKAGSNPDSSYWDSAENKLVIRKGLFRGKEQSTKTPAGNREVDICSVLNDLLKELKRQDGDWLFQSDWQGPIRPMTAYKAAKDVGIPGFHSLRRFRITYLENSGVPLGLIKYWAGHSTTSEITSRYVKSSEDIKLRKEWAEKIGLGFQLA